MGLDVLLKVFKQFKFSVANSTASRQLLSIEVNLSVMLLLLVFVRENFLAQSALEFGWSFLFNAKMDALKMLAKIFGLCKVFVT